MTAGLSIPVATCNLVWKSTFLEAMLCACCGSQRATCALVFASLQSSVPWQGRSTCKVRRGACSYLDETGNPGMDSLATISNGSSTLMPANNGPVGTISTHPVQCRSSDRLLQSDAPSLSRPVANRPKPDRVHDRMSNETWQYRATAQVREAKYEPPTKCECHTHQ